MTEDTRQVQVSTSEPTDAERRQRLVLVYRLLSDLGRRHRQHAPHGVNEPDIRDNHVESALARPSTGNDAQA